MASLRLALIAAVVTALACASSGGGSSTSTSTEPATSTGASKPATPEATAPARQPIPASSPLAKVQQGMTDMEVLQIMGEPDYRGQHATGMQWMPYYFGSDTNRIEFWYRSKGVVVFNPNRWTGVLRVRDVIYDPQALADVKPAAGKTDPAAPTK